MAFNQPNTNKNFIGNPLFRLVAPAFLSLLVYFLVLLVFGTIDEIEFNFFRAELILCITISYLISETNRLLIILLEKLVPIENSLSKRIFIQVAFSTFLIMIITSSAVTFYMKELVGFKSFSSELIVFNSLYILFGWCLHAIYFSLVYLKKVTDIQLINETNRKKAIEAKMEASLKELKPKLLNKCLESIIVFSYENSDKADEYLGKVSDYYRGKLSRKNDLVSLKDDFENALNFVDVYKPWINVILKQEQSLQKDSSELKIMQGTISSVIEYIFETSILVSILQSVILFEIINSTLTIKCNIKPKLLTKKSCEIELERLIESYQLCTQKQIKINQENGLFLAKIPLVKIKSN